MFKRIASITAGLLVAFGAVSAATPAVVAEQGPKPNSTPVAAWDW